MSSFPIEPRLGPPGAGLPFPERLVARMLFRYRAWRTPPPASAAAITSERDRILAIGRRHGAAAGQRRILIPRLRGMEDSSRHWSVFMTVAHVAIVNRGVAATMRDLLAGRVPSRVASTAAVKPPAQADATALADLEQSCSALFAVRESHASLRTPLRHVHPWFGRLDAQDWFFLAGFHLALHRRQLEMIEAGLAG
ncbi:MAG TPA: DinB family protein [Candidatus Didemnitutus sp.]|jgi:hypothetical protein